MIKKIVLVASLVGAVTAAQAVEVGVTGGTNLSSSENAWGVTIGKTVGVMNVTGGFARSSTADSYSVVGAAPVAKLGRAMVAVKAGGVYVDSATTPDGYAVTVGAGASMPLAAKLAATVDYTYQAGQDIVKSQNGSKVTAGLKYSF